MTIPPRALLNPHWEPQPVAPEIADVLAFHRSLAGYEATPLHELSAEATRLGLGAVRLKDESARWGLPAFKILGASWAAERTLRMRPEVRELVAASAGNHGRAVARAAATRGLASRIFLPARVSDERAALIAGEGATIVRVDGSYEDAVARAAAAGAEHGVAVIADVAYDTRAQVPGWIVDGYSTIFAEVAEADAEPYDLVLAQMGVGSFAAAAIQFAASQTPPALVLGVEPAGAACVTASLPGGVPLRIDTAGTTMAGLDCAQPSVAVWPLLRGHLRGCVTVDDTEAHDVMRDLARVGLVVGDCGAAPLAALRALMGDPACAELREALKLGPASRVLVVATEGASDPTHYDAVVRAPAT